MDSSSSFFSGVPYSGLASCILGAHACARMQRAARAHAWPVARLVGPSSEWNDPGMDVAYARNGCSSVRGGRARRVARGVRSAWGTARGSNNAFRIAIEFSVPSQGRRGTAPLNQLCHFYAPRLIFAEFYHSPTINLSACALFALLFRLGYPGRVLERLWCCWFWPNSTEYSGVFTEWNHRKLYENFQKSAKIKNFISHRSVDQSFRFLPKKAS